jgi:hypothetical protein
MYPTEERIAEMCRGYIDMIAWNFAYYTRGIFSVRTDVYYPFRYAPLLYDLVKISDYVPPPERYMREFFGAIPRWEIETMFSTLSDYEVKQTQKWINESKTNDLSGSGVLIATQISGKLFSKRLLTQMAVTIPPGSSNVMSKKQRDISHSLQLQHIRPINFKVDIADIGIEGGIETLKQTDEKKFLSRYEKEEDRVAYLPNMQHNTTHAFILSLPEYDSELTLEPVLDLITTKEQRDAAKAFESLGSFNLSARGGVTRGLESR